MRHVAALDVGTTTVRFYILDEKAITVASSMEKVRRYRIARLRFLNLESIAAGSPIAILDRALIIQLRKGINSLSRDERRILLEN
jgi:glycerol kinase